MRPTFAELDYYWRSLLREAGRPDIPLYVFGDRVCRVRIPRPGAEETETTDALVIWPLDEQAAAEITQERYRDLAPVQPPEALGLVALGTYEDYTVTGLMADDWGALTDTDELVRPYDWQVFVDLGTGYGYEVVQSVKDEREWTAVWRRRNRNISHLDYLVLSQIPPPQILPWWKRWLFGMTAPTG